MHETRNSWGGGGGKGNKQVPDKAGMEATEAEEMAEVASEDFNAELRRIHAIETEKRRVIEVPCFICSTVVCVYLKHD
jgi:hypothetical protein